MSLFNFTLLVADKKKRVIILCQGITKDEEPYWAYLKCKPSHAELLKLTAPKGNFKLMDYGIIEKFGFGNTPEPYEGG